MYAGRVACCHLVSHVEYAPRAVLRLEKTGQTDGRTDGRQIITLRLPLDAVRVIIECRVSQAYSSWQLKHVSLTIHHAIASKTAVNK